MSNIRESNTIQKLRFGEDNFIYEFDLDGRRIDKSEEIKAEIIEEIQEELTFENPNFTCGPLTKNAILNNNIEGIIDEVIEIGLNEGYAAILPSRVNYIDVLLQSAQVMGKPFTVGHKLTEVTVKTHQTISTEEVTVYRTFRWHNEIQGYTVTYTAYDKGNNKLNVQKLMPNIKLDENGVEVHPNQTRIPVAIFKINKKGVSPWVIFSTTLSIINFYAVFELDDAELSKLKILVNGNVLKWSETEANNKLRKGGVLKVGSSKSYTYANPFTVVSAAADTSNIIAARKEHQQALLDAMGVNPIIDTKKAQVGQGEQDKNERHMNRKVQTRKKYLEKTLMDLTMIISSFFNEEEEVSVTVNTYADYEHQKSLEEARVKSNGEGGVKEDVKQ